MCAVENLMREARSQFQVIWTSGQLSAKKTNRAKTVYEQYTFLQTSDLSFLLRATQKSKCFENWSVPHASNCPPPHFFWNFLNFFSIYFDFFRERDELGFRFEFSKLSCLVSLKYVFFIYTYY